MAKLKQIWVKGALEGKESKNKVILWERHEEHPDGEVMVVNDGHSYLVAETKDIKRLMGEGALVAGTERVNWNSSVEENRNRGGRPRKLRPATEAEEDAAGLETPTEKKTAVTEE
jgi:hypothetical protein